jgi:hypothetical protein
VCVCVCVGEETVEGEEEWRVNRGAIVVM